MADDNPPTDEPPTTNTKTTAIDEDDLELSLSLRPLNYSSSSPPSSLLPKNVLEPSFVSAPNAQILSKRDAQALRRHEAKLKRDLKRKSSAKNDVVVGNHQQEDFLEERRRKLLNLGFQGATPPWLGWNAGVYQGQNGNFASQNDGAGSGAGGSMSSGSSSGISDNYQCISGTGGNSSDAGSHSSHPHSPLAPTNAPATSTTAQLQPCSSQPELQINCSNSNVSKPPLCSSYSNKIELVTGSRQLSKSQEKLNMICQQNEAQPNIDDTLSDDNNKTTRTTIPKEAKGEIGKPPKPVGVIDQQKLMFSQMPCVSTTGNGPNGKTLTGFLYKYSKAEVSIICVCHGASFSPAGFVEHAGGVDVEYPLKHIRVVPFALG
ncbi:ninja-family protein AFP2-like [Chenopodium quinoa]|uniref:Ninja-family protein n=1 Tax=Chenopodium quinoa TaxID=63459 RepID=A0A803LNL1_CHEQI|nr:ninja-family protein AFP2-like [Chenopodium quinoa]